MNPNQTDPISPAPTQIPTPEQPQAPQPTPPTQPVPQPPMSPESSPLQPPQPTEQSPAPTITAQPSTHQLPTPNTADKDYAKRLKIVGIVTIVFGVLSALTFFGDDQSAQSYLSLILSIAEVIVGVGLIKHNKIAYIIFNVIAALAVLGGFFVLLGASFFMMMLPTLFALSPLGAIFALLGLIVSIAAAGFYLFALIWLHPKPVRQLLH